MLCMKEFGSWSEEQDKSLQLIGDSCFSREVLEMSTPFIISRTI